MHLWTEYEGKTIDGAYQLGKLLRSEGRNGFFATSDTSGHSAVIRLTESHFDEDALLERLRHVAGLHQNNLIEIEQVGQTHFDGVALTYALMEPNDADLSDVLRERPLTTAETLQVARSVLAAIAALHATGLVHEHIQADNVLAVGETVKLRSDCVRECVADSEFNTPEGCADLRRRDLHDFGLLLLQCLTLEKEWTPALHLAEPFKRIIPHALDGTWTVEQIDSLLNPPAAAARPTTPAASETQLYPSPPPPATQPRAAQPSTAPRSETLTAAAATAAEPSFTSRSHHATPTPASSGFKSIWALYAAAAVILLVVAWHFLGGNRQATATAPAPPPAVQAPATPSGPAAVAPAAGTRPTLAPSSNLPAATAPGWYVVAYTYNHQGQAQTKADRLKRRHNSLSPQVFTPTGAAPYFVTLGGAMTEAEASTVLRRARRNGMPRDTFIRRY